MPRFDWAGSVGQGRQPPRRSFRQRILVTKSGTDCWAEKPFLSASTRLESFRALLAETQQTLGLDVGFVLWNGGSVPEGLAVDALAIKIADEGAIAALLRRPTLDTLLNLWVSARID